MVSVLRLRHLRCQLPVSLVRRLFYRRALPDDSIPAQAPGAVSPSTCQSRRLQLCRCRPCTVQLRHLDIRRHAALRTLLQQAILPGANTRFLLLCRLSLLYTVLLLCIILYIIIVL